MSFTDGYIRNIENVTFEVALSVPSGNTIKVLVRDYNNETHEVTIVLVGNNLPNTKFPKKITLNDPGNDDHTFTGDLYVNGTVDPDTGGVTLAFSGENREWNIDERPYFVPGSFKTDVIVNFS